MFLCRSAIRFLHPPSLRVLILSLLSACSLATFPLATFPLIAHSASPSSSSTPPAPTFTNDPAIDEAVDAVDAVDALGADEASNIETVETVNYSDGKVSLDYPATWQLEVNESGEVGIVNLPETPLGLVETRLYRVEAPPDPLVNANIDSFIDEGADVSRYRSVTVDEQSALVIWVAERPGELSSAIATFIGYGDETIFLFSRYSPENSDAEASILSIHGSFMNLPTDSEAAADAETQEDLSVSEEAVSPAEEQPILPTEELPLQENLPIQDDSFQL